MRQESNGTVDDDLEAFDEEDDNFDEEALNDEAEAANAAAEVENGEDNFDEDGEKAIVPPKEASTAELRKSLMHQRMIRPSSIVQVNTGALEIHLQSIKKQLLRHEAEIAHPSWLDAILEEVNKVCNHPLHHPSLHLS